MQSFKVLFFLSLLASVEVFSASSTHQPNAIKETSKEGKNASKTPKKTCCPERFWIAGEYTLSWLKDAPLVPLVTTSPPGTPKINAGVLGFPTTTILYGNHDIDIDARSGFRLGLGVYLDQKKRFSLEGNGFWISPKHEHFNATSSGTPILARPFFNVLLARQDSSVIAFPGMEEGSINISTKSGGLWGAELDAAYHIHRPSMPNCPRYVHRAGWLAGDVFAGFRFLQLEENLMSNQSQSVLGGPIMNIKDSFKTHNNFYGLQLGGRLNWEKRWFFCDIYGEVGIGATREAVKIQGYITPSVVPPQPGGFLALSTNIGDHRRTVFSLVPEAGINLGIKPIKSLRIFMGYSFLYWDKVARPGNEINLNINTNLLPPVASPLVGPAQPSFKFHNTDLWKQMLNFGLEYIY